MSYTYLAIDPDGVPVVAFHQKHELARWCQREIDEGFPSGGWASLYRTRSYPWADENGVVELLYDREIRALINKVPG